MFHRFVAQRLSFALSLTVLFAFIHSLLASPLIKRSVAKIVGERYAVVGYRLGYNLSAIGSLFGIIQMFQDVPDQRWYRVRPPWSWLLRAGQFGGTILGAWGIIAGGIGEFSGVRPLGQMHQRLAPSPAQEGHGPWWNGRDAFVMRGPFHATRHPVNWG